MTTTATTPRKTRSRKPAVTPAEAPVQAVAAPVAPSPESLWAGAVLDVHTVMNAHDGALLTLNEHRVRVCRATYRLYFLAETDHPDLLAERGTMAGKPAVSKLATELGYERRRFEPFYKGALALFEAGLAWVNPGLDTERFATTEDDVTEADITAILPFFEANKARMAKRRESEKAQKDAETTAPDDMDSDGDVATVTATPAADSPVTVADIMASIKALKSTVERFTGGDGITRDVMDTFVDEIADITAMLEGVVAE